MLEYRIMSFVLRKKIMTMHSVCLYSNSNINLGTSILCEMHNGNYFHFYDSTSDKNEL